MNDLISFYFLAFEILIEDTLIIVDLFHGEEDCIMIRVKVERLEELYM